jgi:hypothetical protein
LYRVGSRPRSSSAKNSSSLFCPGFKEQILRKKALRTCNEKNVMINSRC